MFANPTSTRRGSLDRASEGLIRFSIAERSGRET
jgi:hypothetical protein